MKYKFDNMMTRESWKGFWTLEPLGYVYVQRKVIGRQKLKTKCKLMKERSIIKCLDLIEDGI